MQQYLGRKIRLEIGDMDDLTIKGELEAVINKALRRDIESTKNLKISAILPNSRECKLVLIETGEINATELLSLGKRKIGWANCKIKLRPIVKRCFRYQGFGHVAKRCDNVEK